MKTPYILMAALLLGLCAGPLTVCAQQRQRGADGWEDRREVLRDLQEQQRYYWDEREQLEELQSEITRFQDRLDELWDETDRRLQELEDEEESNNPRSRRYYYRSPRYDERWDRGQRYQDRRYDSRYWRYDRPRYRGRYYGTPQYGYFEDPRGGEGVRLGRFQVRW